MLDAIQNLDLREFTRELTAEAAARAVLRVCSAGVDLPIDVFRVATTLGVRLVPRPDESLGNTVGRVTLDDGHGAVIEYRASDPSVRQRFTIAHELGHLVLGHVNPGRPCMQDEAGAFSRSTRDVVEAAANRFAMELLMPADTVEYLIERARMRPTLANMAAVLEVSEAAMHYRLKHLGWL